MWKDAITGIASVSRPRPTRYAPLKEADADTLSSMAIGTAVTCRHNVMCATEPRLLGAYPFPPLVRCYAGSELSPIPRGSLLVYAGHVRTLERKRVHGKSLDVSVIKHTFITPQGRCIVNDLSLLQL